MDRDAAFRFVRAECGYRPAIVVVASESIDLKVSDEAPVASHRDNVADPDVSKLTGYAPALPTTFGVAADGGRDFRRSFAEAAEGDIDISAFERLCDLQLAHGATALIVCGTTGGSAYIDPGRTSLAHPNCRCTDSRANSHHWRGWRERNSACDRISPRRRGSWGGCCFVSRAILQQADAGGALCSLSGDRGIDRTADHSL